LPISANGFRKDIKGGVKPVRNIQLSGATLSPHAFNIGVKMRKRENGKFFLGILFLRIKKGLSRLTEAFL
jgi:hypothetical protein